MGGLSDFNSHNYTFLASKERKNFEIYDINREKKICPKTNLKLNQIIKVESTQKTQKHQKIQNVNP